MGLNKIGVRGKFVQPCRKFFFVICVLEVKAFVIVEALTLKDFKNK